MRGRMTAIARTIVVYLAIVLGAAAVGALVAHLMWDQWFLGALGAGCLAAWFALPSGLMETGWSPSQPFNSPRRPRDDRR